jgi:tellurite resistance protein TerC
LYRWPAILTIRPPCSFLLAALLDRFAALKFGLAALLFLVGLKMLLADLVHIPTAVSLAAIVLILGAPIGFSFALRRAHRAPG